MDGDGDKAASFTSLKESSRSSCKSASSLCPDGALDLCLGFADIASRRGSDSRAVDHPLSAAPSGRSWRDVSPRMPQVTLPDEPVRHNRSARDVGHSFPSSPQAPRRKSLKSVRVSSFQDTQETEHVNRVFNWIVSVAEGNEGRAKINIKELGASWKLFALRAFHVWTFFLAIVVIGDFFTGAFLDLFLTYYQNTVKYGAVRTWRSIIKLFLTCSWVILLIFFASGLLERAFWLLADSMEKDMFRIYRKTLCFESAGPGGDIDFLGQRHKKMRIVWDIIVQWIIFFTLDLVPIGMAIISIAHEPFMKGVWVTRLVECSVGAACFHIFVYYVWSTLMDFFQKAKMFWQVWFQMERMMNLPTRQVLRSNFGLDDDGGGTVEGRNTRGNYINACACMENALSTNFCQVSLVALAILGLTGSCFFIITHNSGMQVVVVISSLSFLAVVTRFRYRPGQRLEMEFTRFLTLSELDWDKNVWAPWFARNCGISRISCFIKSAVVFVGCVGLVFLGLYTREVFTVCVGTFGASLSCVIIVTSVCFPNELWKLMMVVITSFTVVTLVFGLIVEERLKFVQLFMLILITQMGLSLRRSHRQPGILVAALFLVLGVIIAVVTLMAATSDTGAPFDETKTYDWCADGLEGCVDIQFPTFGDPSRSYSFCGISWPMGISGVDSQTNEPLFDTVSERCNDTQLSIVDFGQMSSVPYYLPDKPRASEVLHRYFPGWAVKSVHNLDSKAEKYLTFVHLARGSTHVIAVRGTASATDTLQDLTFWMPAVLTDLALRLGPDLVGSPQIARLLKRVTGAGFKRSYIHLLNYTQREMTKNPGEQFYITGHSLGGGIATIVASFLHIPAITFSAPGLYSTSQMLDPSPKLEEIRTYTLNVVPMWDLVPQADAQTGTQLGIDCDTPEDPLSCHRLSNTMCNLMSSCGDGGGRPVPRGFTRKCDLCQSRLSPFPDLVEKCSAGL